MLEGSEVILERRAQSRQAMGEDVYIFYGQYNYWLPLPSAPLLGEWTDDNKIMTYLTPIATMLHINVAKK